MHIVKSIPLRVGLVLGLVALASPGWAKSTKRHRAATPVPTPAAQPVEVEGDIPESLNGTWLLIINAEMDGKFLNGWHAYRFAGKGSQWQVTELVGSAPPPLQAALDSANAAGTPLHATPEIIQAVAAAIHSLHAPHAGAYKNVLRAADHFGAADAALPQAKDAKFVFEFLAKGTSVLIAGNSYYVQEVTADEMTGALKGGSVVQAPTGMVIPVPIAGPISMHRLQ
jgi:hypothetical protein